MASGEDWEAEVVQTVISPLTTPAIDTSTTITTTPQLETIASACPIRVTSEEDALLDTEWTFRPSTLPASTESTESCASTQEPSVPESDTVDGSPPLQPVEIAQLEPLIEEIESVGLEEANAATRAAADKPDTVVTDVPMTEPEVGVAGVTAEPPAMPEAPVSAPPAPVASSADVGSTEDIPPAPKPTAPKPTASDSAASAAQDDWDKQVS